MADAASWDFFLAHASDDRAPAEALYDLLAPKHRVFIDKRNVMLGEDWDLAIARAQHAARVTVVLVSSRYPNAYYLREEIAEAIAMARKDPDAHRVVPVYLDGWPAEQGGMPYGLRLKNGVDAKAAGGIPGVAAALEQLLAQLDGKPPAPAPPAGAPPGPSHDRIALCEALCKMLPSQFEMTVFYTGAPTANLLPQIAPLATRALDLVMYMEQHGMDGLDKLARAINKVAPHLLRKP
jgi:hypothetical protein